MIGITRCDPPVFNTPIFVYFQEDSLVNRLLRATDFTKKNGPNGGLKTPNEPNHQSSRKEQ